MCRFLFFNKVASLRPITLLKTDSHAGVSSEFCKVFKKNVLQNISGRPLLFIHSLLLHRCLTGKLFKIAYYTRMLTEGSILFLTPVFFARKVFMVILL